MDLELDRQVAAVVGGAAGIGLAIGKAFLAEGADVVLIDRNRDTPTIAAGLAGEKRRRAIGIIADATELAATEKAAQRVLADFGRCDHVVHAAAIGSGKRGFPFWNLQPAEWPRVLEVNVVAAVNVV